LLLDVLGTPLRDRPRVDAQHATGPELRDEVLLDRGRFGLDRLEESEDFPIQLALGLQVVP
jgi:hypothetical protein